MQGSNLVMDKGCLYLSKTKWSQLRTIGLCMDMLIKRAMKSEIKGVGIFSRTNWIHLHKLGLSIDSFMQVKMQ